MLCVREGQSISLYISISITLARPLAGATHPGPRGISMYLSLCFSISMSIGLTLTVWRSRRAWIALEHSVSCVREGSCLALEEGRVWR